MRLLPNNCLGLSPGTSNAHQDFLQEQLGLFPRLAGIFRGGLQGNMAWTTTAEGKTLADIPMLCAMVNHLHHRLCCLNPEGRGLVPTALFTPVVVFWGVWQPCTLIADFPSL